MTGRRKSCKTCKKVAANSLPCVETNVPVVDGFLYQNSDHDENPTPGFSSRVADAISDPATSGIADAALGRTEPTPGFRKTASHKAAIQASSFTAVAPQTVQPIGAAGDPDSNKDSGKNSDKNNNCSSGDKKDPKDAAECSDEHASKSAVAVSVTLSSDPENDALRRRVKAAQQYALNLPFGWDEQTSVPYAHLYNSLASEFKNTEVIVGAPFIDTESGKFFLNVLKLHSDLEKELSRHSLSDARHPDGKGDYRPAMSLELREYFRPCETKEKATASERYQTFLESTFFEYATNPSAKQFITDAYLFIAEVGIHACFNKEAKHGHAGGRTDDKVTGNRVKECLEGIFGARSEKITSRATIQVSTCLRNLHDHDSGTKKSWTCFDDRDNVLYDHRDVVSMYLFGDKPTTVSSPKRGLSDDENGSEMKFWKFDRTTGKLKPLQ